MVWYDKANCGNVDELQQKIVLGVAGIVTDHAGGTTHCYAPAPT